MKTVEPQGIFPWVTQLWHEHHDDVPLVVVRCGKCLVEVGRVWDTPRGLLAELRQTRPGREMRVSPSAATKPEKFSVMRPDGTGHSKRTPITSAVIMLEMDLQGMLVACPTHGDLNYDAHGLQTVCQKAFRDRGTERTRPRSARLQPIVDQP